MRELKVGKITWYGGADLSYIFGLPSSFVYIQISDGFAMHDIFDNISFIYISANM